MRVEDDGDADDGVNGNVVDVAVVFQDYLMDMMAVVLLMLLLFLFFRRYLMDMMAVLLLMLLLLFFRGF